MTSLVMFVVVAVHVWRDGQPPCLVSNFVSAFRAAFSHSPGNNDGGQLGYEDNVPRGIAVGEMGDLLPAVDLGTEQKAVAVAAGFFHTCALIYTGDIKCWGELINCKCDAHPEGDMTRLSICSLDIVSVDSGGVSAEACRVGRERPR